MRPRLALPLGALALPAIAAPALGCGPMATISFLESSPSDRFEIANNSSDDWELARVGLALKESAGGLIFDTMGGGPGTSMYRPFAPGAPAPGAPVPGAPAPETPAGPPVEAVAPAVVADGGTTLDLGFSGFRPGARFAFTIDVDDTLVYSDQGRMRVTESEIEGALATALFRDPEGGEMALDGHFGPDGIAIVSGLACS